MSTEAITVRNTKLLMVNGAKFCHFEKGANLVWMI